MRSWPLLGVLLGALGVLGWLTSRRLAAPGVEEPRDRPQASRVDMGGLLQGLSRPGPSPSQESSRSIRGRVKGPHGPVAGVQLRASREVPGESLSKRPCSSPLQGSGDFLLDCQEFEHVSELVEQRQGEVPVLARTTSVKDGSFVLEGLEAGTYALWAEGPEGATVLEDVEAGRQGVEVTLGVGTRLSGTVTQEGAAPIAGALVTAIFTHHSRFFEALSDGTGHFTLGPLPRGEYVLLASHEGWLPVGEQVSAARSTLESALVLDRPRRVSGRVTREGLPVEGARVRTGTSPASVHEVLTDASGHFVLEGLSPRLAHELIATQGELGARSWVDFKDPEGVRHDLLMQCPEVSLELEPVTYVKGHVLDTARRPVVGAHVSLEAMTGEFYSSVARTRTDAEGHYELGPVPPGTMRLDLRAEGRLLSKHKPWSDFPAGTLERDLLLAPEFPVEGTVVDASGQPVAHARMTLSSPKHPLCAAGESGPDGHFLLNAPAPEAYGLDLDSSRVREESQHHEVVAPAQLRLIVSLLPRVMGEVVDESGAPVSQVAVSLWPEERTLDAPPLASEETDARGRFSLSAPGPGRYRLAAEFQQEGLVHSVSQAVLLGEGDSHVRLSLEPGRVLAGVVVDGRGRPLEGVRVEVHSSSHVRGVRCVHGRCGTDWGEYTGIDGRFSFPSVSGEALELEVSAQGHRLRTRPEEPPRSTLSLEPGAREVRVVLVREARVHGRLVRADGSPVIWFFVNGEERESESGEFSWPIVGTGTLQLELSALELRPDVTTVRRSVSVREEVDQELGAIVLGGP